MKKMSPNEKPFLLSVRTGVEWKGKIRVQKQKGETLIRKKAASQNA